MPFPIALVAGLAMSGAQYGMASAQASEQNQYRRQLQIKRNEQYRKNVKYQKDLMEFYTKRYEQTAIAAKTDADQQYATIFDAIQQRRKQAFSQIDQYSRQTVKASGMYRAKNYETTGQSKQLALQQFAQIESSAAAVIHDNLEGSMRDSQRRLNAIQAQAQNRINQAMPQPMKPIFPGDAVQGVYQPGGLDLALSLGNVVASSYADSASRQGPNASVGQILQGMA